MSRPAAITSALLGASAIAFVTSVALPFDDRVEFRANNRVDSKPAWLVPQKAEFLGIQRGYGGLKILAAIAGTTAMGGVMVISRSQAAREPVRQKIRQYRNQAEEFEAAAAAAYQMALKQQEYKTMLEAQQVVFEEHVMSASLEAMGIDPDQKALPGTTLDQITNPGDKVRDAEVKPAIADARGDAIASNPESEPGFIKAFIASTCLAWGSQGGGKSWFVRYLAKRKVDQGYRLIVFDPNSNRTEWQGVELVNTYPAIEAKMRWYVDEVQGRYAEFGQSEFTEAQWRSQLWQQGKAISVICEEATTYSDFIEDEELLATFVKVATTLSRKQEMPVMFVAHNNTQTCLGNIKGLANLIKRMQQIQLLSKTDPDTSQPVASGKALVKLDGSDEWVEVEVPLLGSKIVDFRPTDTQRDRNLVNPQTLDPEYFERLYNLEFDLKRSDSPTDSPKLSDGQSTCPADNPTETDSPRQPEPLSDEVSGFTWSVRKVRELYPDTTPEQLFQSVSASARTPNVTARDVIKSILKCREGNDHPSRSYTRHGKTLLRWLIENYDDGAIASLPEIKKFLEAQP